MRITLRESLLICWFRSGASISLIILLTLPLLKSCYYVCMYNLSFGLTYLIGNESYFMISCLREAVMLSIVEEALLIPGENWNYHVVMRCNIFYWASFLPQQSKSLILPFTYLMALWNNEILIENCWVSFDVIFPARTYKFWKWELSLPYYVVLATAKKEWIVIRSGLKLFPVETIRYKRTLLVVFLFTLSSFRVCSRFTVFALLYCIQQFFFSTAVLNTNIP